MMTEEPNDAVSQSKSGTHTLRHFDRSYPRKVKAFSIARNTDALFGVKRHAFLDNLMADFRARPIVE
jgi:hypothetical protein